MLKYFRNNFLSILVLLIISGCSTPEDLVELSVRSDTKFSKNATITIDLENDGTGTRGELTHLLFERGFNVVPYSTAKQAVKYKEKIKKGNTGDIEIDAKVYNIKELNSIYVLEINYRYYTDSYGKYCYKNFSAKVINLNTNELVMTANFRGGELIFRVLEDFADKLSSKIE